MNDVNRDYLALQLRRLRLYFERRVVWLREQWRHSGSTGFDGTAVGDAQADLILAGRTHAGEESRLYREHPRASLVSAAICELESRIGALQDNEAAAVPLERLIKKFDLTSFDRDVVMLCMAPELDPGFEQLFAYAQDDAHRRFATSNLALDLFALCSRAENQERLTASSPLRRYRLLTLEAGETPATPLNARPLRLAGRIVEYIQGFDGQDPLLAGLRRAARPANVSLADPLSVESLVSLIRHRRGAFVVNLIGPRDTGKRLLADAASRCLGLRLEELDARRMPHAGLECDELTQAVAREARLSDTAIYIEAPEFDAPSGNAAAFFDDFVGRAPCLLFLDSRERRDVGQPSITFAVARPSRRQQRQLWRSALGGLGAHEQRQIDRIVQQFDFGPEIILRSAEEAAMRSGPGANADLWTVCREKAGWHLDAVAQRIQPSYSWDDIVLDEDGMQQLREIAGQVSSRATVYEDWGFGRQLSRGRGISALFAGPSGTGKTMAAEVLAHHLALDLYRIDLAGVINKYIGETEKNLARLFDEAEQSGAILFFDEADALFGKRTEVKDSHDRYANIEVNYLLQRMEEYSGLAILATNRKSSLDRAFLRRLRFLVDFPFPDKEARRSIWEKVFPPGAPVADLDFDFLARLEIAGGNIRNIALNAAFLAAEERGPIRAEHVIHAVRREYAKIDKVITESEFGIHYRPRR